MAEPLTSALSEDGTEILLSSAEKAEPSEENAWRLSFNRISQFERDERSQQRGFHDCFSLLGLTLPVGQVYLVESRDGITSEFRQNI